MLNWAKPFNIFCLLDNGQYNIATAAFECLLAAGCKANIACGAGSAFVSLKEFYSHQKGWLFGHLGYDLKNEIEALSSKNNPLINFGLSFFFEPEILIQVRDGKFEVINSLQKTAEIFDEIKANPKRYPIVHADIREGIVPQFPYCVYYRELKTRTVVIGVIHTARDPALWQSRR